MLRSTRARDTEKRQGRMMKKLSKRFVAGAAALLIVGLSVA